jgi:hypothetical protein
MGSAKKLARALAVEQAIAGARRRGRSIDAAVSSTLQQTL